MSNIRGLTAFKIMSVLFAALAGGAYWCTVRSAGEGSGPSMGLMWGLYWVLLLTFIFPSGKFPVQGSFVLLVVVVGFAIGGTQGYGQFNQWMRGRFYQDVDHGLDVPISRAYGYCHLFICGLAWGGIPALLLSWLIFSKESIWVWAFRIFLTAAGVVLTWQILELYPRCFHPLYSEGLYADLEYCVDCQRTLDTARNTYAHLGGFLFPAVFTLWRNKASRYLVVPVSLGFALTFSTGGFLHSLQVAKVWNKIYGLDVRDLFDYFETGAVVIAAGMFLYKVYVYYHNYRRREQLLVDRPVMLFLLVYSGFFWLIMFRWVYVPFSLEKNIITLLAMSAYLISLVVFYQMRKNAVATGVTGQSS